MKKIFQTILLVFFCITFLNALSTDRLIHHYVHQSWGADDGLPQNSVYSIVQDHHGFIWAATAEGFVRFDGVSFDVFDSSNVPGLKMNWITSLLVDKNNRLWIGTNGNGLFRYENEHFTRVFNNSITGENAIKALYEDTSGNIWIGTKNAGVFRFDGKTYTQFSTKHGLTDNRIYNIREDKSGAIWLATNMGISRIVHNRVENPFAAEKNKFSYRIRGLYFDSSHRLWIGTVADGVFVFDGKTLQPFGEDFFKKNEIIIQFLEDADGAIWFGTYANGILRYFDKKFERAHKSVSFHADRIYSLFEDKDKNLWIGSLTNGLSIIKEGDIITYSTIDGFKDNNLRMVYADNKGRVLASTYYNGLFIKDSEYTFAPSPYKNINKDNEITSIAGNKKETFYVATRHNGFYEVKNNIVTQWNTDKGLPFPSISALFFSSDEELVIGTFGGGIITFDDGNFTYVDNHPETKSMLMRFVMKDSTGKIWAAPDTGGIRLIENDEVKHIGKKEGATDGMVFAFYEDTDGNIWIGTYGDGLYLYKNNKFYQFTKKDGLFDNVIYVVVEDDYGYLWMTSNKGIFRIKRSDLIALSIKEITSVKSRVFTTDDGMITNECNGGQYTPGFKSPRDGKLYFCTLGGLAVIDPQNITQKRPSFPVIIKKIVVDGETISHNNKRFSLTPDVQRVEFHYTAITYDAPEKITFSYKLENFDDEWINAETQRIASFTNLPSGTYSFIVKAKNRNNQENNILAAIAFNKKTHYYETLWFKALIVIVFILCIGLIIKLRLRVVEVRNEELSRLVEQKTKELQITNNNLQKLNHELQERVLRDELTGLRNRRYLMEFMVEEAASHAKSFQYFAQGSEQREIDSEKIFGIYMIDLDFFKGVNDIYGHEAGDMVLKQLATIFKTNVRSDDVITRWGGEEFVIILKHIKPEFLDRFAEKLRKAVEEHIFNLPDGTTLKKTCSVGYLKFPFYIDAPHMISLEQSIALADHGLYFAKNHGRNQSICVNPKNIPENQYVVRHMLSSLEFCQGFDLITIVSASKLHRNEKTNE